MMSSLLDKVMHEFVQASCSIFGEAVKEIILFGSYARNEANDESDIDVMVLLDTPREQIPAYRRKIAPIASELLLQHGIVVSPVLESKAFFDRNRTTYPFFRNVDQEGIRYA